MATAQELRAMGAKQYEAKLQEAIQLRAKVDGCSLTEAMERLFAENPQMYRVYDRFQSEGLLGTPRQAEAKAEAPRVGAAEHTINTRAQELREREPGLSLGDAVTRVCQAQPELYARYLREMKGRQ